MGNKKKIVILSLLILSLIGIYLGKNYGDKRKEITSSEINIIKNLEDAKKGIPTIIMFKTDTCPYCVEMQKEIRGISEKYPEKFNVYYARLEEDRNMDLAYKYRVNVVPTTVFLDKNGKEFYTQQGLMRADYIENVLKSLGVN
ncbi:thioredoxin family protein [Clostridium sp.]|uniref:thioredoxin family protein n=1 Tax=Clostridium sp. TaxID=1506 RepID=UPI00260B4669|nr:thioredoxin family protein [Clostridium sp.]